MKKLTLSIAVASLLLTSCFGSPEKAKKAAPQNPLVWALLQANNTFDSLAVSVDSISAPLSEIEQQRAAFFLVSAYSIVMQSYVERGNPATPALTDWMTPPRKFGGDNPYTIYSQAPISDEFTYKLSGKSGNAIYMGVQLYGYADGFNVPTGNLSKKEMKLNPDGSFDVYIGKIRPKGAKNFIEMADTDHAFIVRQYFNRRTGIVPAKLSIARTDDNPSKGTSYLERLEKTNKMMTDYILGTIEVTNLLRENAYNKYADKNAEVRLPRYGGALYPTKNNNYEGCWVALKEGEAMHVHGYLPKNTLYASYVFYDRWYNTPSYPEVNCFRTMNEIALNPDKSFDLYISPEKIDHPNWLNTGGLYEGSYSSRYLESTETVFPTIELVKTADIKPYIKKTKS